jgi:hypothetical protein
MNTKILFFPPWKELVEQHIKYTAMVRPPNRKGRTWIGLMAMTIHFENPQIPSEVAQIAVSLHISDREAEESEEMVIKEKRQQGHLSMIDLLQDRFQFGCTRKRKIPLFEAWQPIRNWKENKVNKQNSSFEASGMYYYKVAFIELINLEGQ